MIWLDGRQYRDELAFAEEYLERQESEPAAEVKPPSDDQLLREAQAQALDSAREPIAARQEEAGRELAEESWPDYKSGRNL